MSITKEIKQTIKLYMLEKIGNEEKDFIKKTVDCFNISRNSIYRYLHEMESDNIISKKNSNKSYEVVSKKSMIVLHRSQKELRSEDSIYSNYIKPFVRTLPENVQRIWSYAFSEMMNNAIEHSESEKVTIIIMQNYMSTSIMIIDNGIGIFRKIKDYYDYETLDDAICELFKGKLTTDAENHSGEGIFFTSRILDFFSAISDNKIFTHNLYDDKQWDLIDLGIEKTSGTAITMQLSNFSNKQLRDIFDMFSDLEHGFTKTQIPLKKMFDTFPVSRSQAKRLCNRLESFEEVTIDFGGVSELGQGFAHQLFVVFLNKHPGIKIKTINACDNVQFMINHVRPMG